ncbi:Conserved_hypothetical protein [Hexamita inflata]|uniref:Uncharacterized protein n=1 Tax=Hexamita inflata TaxID=28002 RepID=A0AA86RIS8_9EUKA|nr:Conserved hypothetical protein [Hexamita inflata]
MSKTREVFGITVSTETFSVLKSLSQIVSRNQVVDLEVAVSYISQSVQNFVTSDTVLNELTVVLEKITQSTRKQISESIMAYYKQALPERYDLVREGFQALLSQQSVHHPPPQVSTAAKQTVSETPKRQVRKMSEQLVLNPLLRQLQKSKISATVEGRAVYENQLQESPECFSKPLQAQVEKTALFKQLQIPYDEVNLCQYHPSLFLLAAPPQYSFPKLKSLPSMQSYSSMQLEINYSNESHDDPDIIFDAPVYYKWLTNFPQQQLIRNPILSVKTKKPVPQHHSLLDITGVYTNYDSFLISILTQMKLMCAQSKSKKISYLEILSILSKVKYFPPFKMFVDQIHYGNDARYIRFCNSYPSAYLKAVGIGGSVRLQVHCSKDIAKDTELSLLMDYFCCGPGVLFDKMTVYNTVVQQLDAVCVEHPWVTAVNEKIKTDHPNYQFTLENARAAFMLSFINSQISELLEEVSAEQIEQMIVSTLRGGSKKFEFQEVIQLKKKKQLMLSHLFNNDSEQAEEVIDVKDLTILGAISDISQSDKELTYPLIQSLQLAGYLQSGNTFQALMEQVQNIQNKTELKINQHFLALLNNFCLQRAVQYFSNNKSIESEKFLTQIQDLTFMNCNLYIQKYPGFYPNFLPFGQFDLVNYQLFDKFQSEHIYLKVNSILNQYLKEAAQFELKDILKEENIQKICYRFLHQSYCFYKLSLGMDVDLEQYVLEVQTILNQSTYYNLQQSLSECIPVNIDHLKQFLTQTIQTQKQPFLEIIKSLNVVNKPILNKELNQLERELFNEETTRYICEFIINLLQALPPLSKKQKIERKFEAQSSKIDFAQPGYDGGYGWKLEHMPAIKVKGNWIGLTEKSKSTLFQGDHWNYFRWESSQNADQELEEMLRKKAKWNKPE